MTTKIQTPHEVPSAVLHIRSIPSGTTENDLFKITFDHKFGRCVSVRLLERYHQALLEMDSVESATRLLKYSQKNSLLLHGKPVQISFSKSQSINQSPLPQSPTTNNNTAPTTTSTTSPTSTHRQSNYNNNNNNNNNNNGFPPRQSNYTSTPTQSSSQPPIPGTVLLCTIENVGSNHITIDHLYHVFSSSGEVLRIVMFNKSNLQALIEFSSVDSALNAKKTLLGHSLFHGGQCTLKLEVSKTDRLNISQNTDRAKDFTKSTSTTIHHQPSVSYYQQQPNNNNNNSSINGHSSPQQGGSHHVHHNHSHSSSPHHSNSVGHVNNQHNHSHNNNNNHSHQHSHNNHSISLRSTVLLIHGLDDIAMTCDRIFNLFCVYGNVQRVKILSSKKGAALVQMEDYHQADAIIKFYHQLPLFKDTLQINYSKHLSITDSHNPDSPTLSKDFSQSNLNRFAHPINTYKHLYRPSQTLYFSNVPKDYTESNFNQLFQSLNLVKPIGFKIFSTAASTATTTSTTNTASSVSSPTTIVTNVSSPMVAGSSTTLSNNTTTSLNGVNSNPSTPEPTSNSKHADKIVGLLEFPTPQNALDALVLLNNTVLSNSHLGLKLSFSNSTVIPRSSNQQQQQQNNNTTTTTTTSTTTPTNNVNSPTQKHF